MSQEDPDMPTDRQVLRFGEKWPPVSVIMPVLNEERHLEAAVRGVFEQDYRGPLELVLAVGPSRDRTQEVAERLSREDPRMRVVPNPSGRTPEALNAALRETRHDIIVRVDAHGVMPRDYISVAVTALTRTGAENVGGMMVPKGRTGFEQAVAAAMASRLGIGGARFHVGGEEGPVETVYLGVFQRRALEELGGFDEFFSRAQDWELNLRIRKSGGTVWFVPDLRVVYRPRSSLRALARQFFHTGRWRRQVMHRYPDTASLRYLAPPGTVLALCLGTSAALLGAVTGIRSLQLGWLAPLGYGGVVLASSLVLARRTRPRAWPWLPVVLFTMHTTWGIGFLLGSPSERLGKASVPEA